MLLGEHMAWRNGIWAVIWYVVYLYVCDIWYIVYLYADTMLTSDRLCPVIV